MPFDPHKLLARIAADAADRRLDDAAFRQRTLRAVKRGQRALAGPPAPASGSPARQARAAGGQPAARYRFIAVPNGRGGTTSVSVSRAVFDELAHALGGPDKVNEHARKVAAGHKPDSGMSRSAYVVKRLRQRAARTAAPPGGRAPGRARA